MAGHLFLIGFMGAGKSTIGVLLAKKLNRPFIDLDTQIVKQAGMTIPDIFRLDGEPAFRDLESTLLQGLGTDADAVVATGGGVVGREANRDFMQRFGKTIYLQASWTTLKDRLGSGTGRPLAGGTEGWARTHALWQQRCPLYEQADLIISTDGISAHLVVDKILVQLNHAENK